MSRLKDTRRIAILACLSVILVGTLACSVDTPTAPDQVPGPTPDPGPNAWNITVSVEPSELEAASAVPATVSIDVRSRDDGSRPPNGTTVSVSTSLGEFDESGSETTARGLALRNGKGSVLLFAGDVQAAGKITARLEGSEGRRSFEVIGEPQDPFILSVTPPTGAAGGGTSVTITGVGFRDNVRVFFGSKLATITSLSEDRIVAVTPPGDMATEVCDDNFDDLSGVRTLDTPVNVTVEFADGGSETLSNGFTYLSPAPGVCQGD